MQQERACFQCDEYKPQNQLLQRADAQYICQKCKKVLDDAAAHRAQISLFDQQESLFA